MENNFTIFSVHHKPFSIPNVSYIKPIQAGKLLAKVNLGFEGDDGKDNISNLNKNFAELTVIYHIWKNYSKDELPFWGICHYRRFFCMPKNLYALKRIYKFTNADAAFQKIFNTTLQQTITQKLQQGYIILPKKYHFIKLKKWSVKQQFIKDHDAISWQYTEDAIKKLYPDYFGSINEFMNGLTCSWYNMLIADWNFWNEYLTFLFDVIFEVKAKLIVKETDTLIRVFGNISERLLCAFVHLKQKDGLKVFYLPVAEIR